jgi:hypothetical protein
VPDKAVISHRGEKYEIGRGKRFYGIWTVGAPYDAPVDRWPENPSGWQQAWARFATIESPGTIQAVPRERKARPWLRRPGGGLPRPRGHVPLFVGEGLLVLGVVLGLAGLFPAYFASQGQASQSLLSQPDQVVAHLCYVLGWAVSAALIALSVARPATARLGALFGLGLGVVTFGLFLADLGQVTQAGISAGSGLVVSLLGWLACTAGSAVALAIKAADDRQGPADQPVPDGGLAAAGQYAPFAQPARQRRKHAGPLALLVLAALGAAAAFFPSWDSYTLVASATGQTQTITEGNAFTSHYPGLVVAGDVAVMVAIVVIAALAALWRPPRQGALLLAGAIVPLAAQAVSALIQVSQPVTPALFGISAAQAQAAGLSISAGVTPIYWVFFVFVVSLLVSCAWLFTEPGHQAMPAFTGYRWPQGGPGAPAATEDVTSDSVTEGAPSDSVTEGASTDLESEASEQKANEEEADSAAAPDGGGQSAYA